MFQNIFLAEQFEVFHYRVTFETFFQAVLVLWNASNKYKTIKLVYTADTIIRTCYCPVKLESKLF